MSYFNSMFTVSNLSDKNISGIGTSPFSFKMKAYSIVLSCFVGGRQIVMFIVHVVYVCAKVRNRKRVLEGK